MINVELMDMMGGLDVKSFMEIVNQQNQEGNNAEVY